MERIKPKKTELIILAALAVVLVIWILLPHGSGGSVSVTVNGKAAGSYSLLQDQRVWINGYADYGLELVIEGGKAHVENALCPDLICQNHAAISAAGAQIICLPARIVITVEKDPVEEEETFDAVVG